MIKFRLLGFESLPYNQFVSFYSTTFEQDEILRVL